MCQDYHKISWHVSFYCTFLQDMHTSIEYFIEHVTRTIDLHNMGVLVIFCKIIGYY